MDNSLLITTKTSKPMQYQLITYWSLPLKPHSGSNTTHSGSKVRETNTQTPEALVTAQPATLTAMNTANNKGEKASRLPLATEMPLPPWNFKYGDQLCPMTASNGATASHSENSKPNKYWPTQIGDDPFTRMSKTPNTPTHRLPTW